jgi:hypothetical protein
LLFNSILAFRVYRTEEVSLPSYEYLGVDEATQFTLCLDVLKNKLSRPPSTTLQIWYVGGSS